MRKRLKKKLERNFCNGSQWPERIIKKWMSRKRAQYIVNRISSDILESVVIPIRMMSIEEFKEQYPSNNQCLKST